MKKCSKCDTVKPLDEFYRQSRNADGRSAECAECRRQYNLALYHQNKDRTNPERNKKRRDTKYARDYHLKRRYGLSATDYAELVERQDNRCAICNQPEKQRDPRYDTLLELAVDHCHATGRIRGLLCSACNTAIGKFNDDPNIIRAAIQYLEMQKPSAETEGSCT